MIEIYVQGDLFTNDELDVLTSDQYRFKKLETLGFSPELVIMALIECGQNVGYNAVYDTIKYIISLISNKCSQKKNANVKKTRTIIDITHGEKRFRIDTQVPLSEDSIVEISKKALDSLND